MKASLSEGGRQGTDYAEKASVQSLHAAVSHGEGDAPISIKPFSLWVLVICGLTIFFLGFFWSRSGLDVTDATGIPGNQQSLPASAATTSGAVTPAAKAPVIVPVTMRNMKFEPAAVELKTGDTVEWRNQDITPHTATSASFDSASIDPDKTWQHTFDKPGNFPYACTFHPDMKAIVTVK